MPASSWLLRSSSLPSWNPPASAAPFSEADAKLALPGHACLLRQNDVFVCRALLHMCVETLGGGQLHAGRFTVEAHLTIQLGTSTGLLLT